MRTKAMEAKRTHRFRSHSRIEELKEQIKFLRSGDLDGDDSESDGN